MPLNFLAIGIAIDKLDQNKMYYQLWIKIELYMHHTQTSTKKDNLTQYFDLSVLIAIKLIESFDQMCRCLGNQT